MERIFIRCHDDFSGRWYRSEVEAELAFEVNGFKFFFHDLRVTEGLCGAMISEMKWWEFGEKELETKEEFLARTERLVKENWAAYIKLAKEALKTKRASFKTPA